MNLKCQTQEGQALSKCPNCIPEQSSIFIGTKYFQTFNKLQTQILFYITTNSYRKDLLHQETGAKNILFLKKSYSQETL